MKAAIVSMFIDVPIIKKSIRAKNTENIIEDIIISDIMGKIVFEEKNISGKKYRIDRNHLSQGMYFLKLNRNNELVYSTKLIVTD